MTWMFPRWKHLALTDIDFIRKSIFDVWFVIFDLSQKLVIIANTDFRQLLVLGLVVKTNHTVRR